MPLLYTFIGFCLSQISVSDGFTRQRLDHSGPARINVEILNVHILGQFAPWDNVSNHKLGSPQAPISAGSYYSLSFIIVESDLGFSGTKKKKQKLEIHKDL